MDAAPLPRRARLRAALRETPMAWAIAAADVAWFAWMAAHGSTTDGELLSRFGALDPLRVRAGDWWRLLTAAFVHVGPVHLVLNVGFGVPLCRLLERVARPPRFAAIYVATALAGSAASLLAQGELTAGSSGALFGVIGAILALHRRALGGWRAFAASRAARAVLANFAILALLGLAVPVDHWAHAGGFAAGAAMAWLWTRPPPRSRVPWLVAAALLAALAAAALRPGRPASAYERHEAVVRIRRALEANDLATARGALALARGLPMNAPELDLLEANLLAREGRTGDAFQLLLDRCRTGNASACEALGLRPPE